VWLSESRPCQLQEMLQLLLIVDRWVCPQCSSSPGANGSKIHLKLLLTTGVGSPKKKGIEESEE
jgi:hypothetical protein